MTTPPTKTDTANSSGTVLVVDDERTARVFSSRVLENAGFRVLQASSGADALRLLETIVPDVLVTDIMMPGMDGVELALKIRRAGPRIRIVFTTGFAASERATVASRIGPILEKPFLPADLRRAVRQPISMGGGVTPSRSGGTRRDA